MAINSYNIKKWFKMLTGKSILHVNQGIGKSFSTSEIKGYYNDLTEKVLKQPELLETTNLPEVIDEKGNNIIFPVAVFQYGLGAFDLYLQSNDDKYLKKFNQCVEWTLKNQEVNGAWNAFFFYYPEHPYGAMAQGEGVSLLLRAYVHTLDEKYYIAAQKAIDFMLLPIEDGGTAEKTENGLVLREYSHRKAVLNGWIFAMFGLYDFSLCSKSDGLYSELFMKSAECLSKMLPKFDAGYWSNYDLEGRISSSFYHNLHIGQMKALYEITGIDVFNQYYQKWIKSQNSSLCRTHAFIKKAIQKVME